MTPAFHDQSATRLIFGLAPGPCTSRNRFPTNSSRPRRTSDETGVPVGGTDTPRSAPPDSLIANYRPPLKTKSTMESSFFITSFKTAQKLFVRFLWGALMLDCCHTQPNSKPSSPSEINIWTHKIGIPCHHRPASTSYLADTKTIHQMSEKQISAQTSFVFMLPLHYN